jgi:hypothetical protein
MLLASGGQRATSGENRSVPFILYRNARFRPPQRVESLALAVSTLSHDDLRSVTRIMPKFQLSVDLIYGTGHLNPAPKIGPDEALDLDQILEGQVSPGTTSKWVLTLGTPLARRRLEYMPVGKRAAGHWGRNQEFGKSAPSPLMEG